MQYAHHGSIEITYETFGSPDGAPLLLISGTAVQMLIWPDEFCRPWPTADSTSPASTTATPASPPICTTPGRQAG